MGANVSGSSARVKQRVASVATLKGESMRKEYDLVAGKPNPYAKRIGAAGRSILLERFLSTEGYVRLDDDVAEAFERSGRERGPSSLAQGEGAGHGRVAGACSAAAAQVGVATGCRRPRRPECWPFGPLARFTALALALNASCSPAVSKPRLLASGFTLMPSISMTCEGERAPRTVFGVSGTF
jgi:hypothetical protein